MKAISLLQPWATFVTMKWKTIETRTHARFECLAGERIVIHSAQKIDEAGFYNQYLEKRIKSFLDIQNIMTFISIRRGTLMCTALVRQAVWADRLRTPPEGLNQKAMCDTSGKFLLFLEDIRPFVSRTSFKGGQGIFNVPDNLIYSGLEIS